MTILTTRVLAAAFLLASPLAAQALPRTCYALAATPPTLPRLDAGRSLTYLLAKDSAVAQLVRVGVWASMRPVLERLRAEDTVAFDAALARQVVTAAPAPDGALARAAAYYELLSGKAQPMLSMLAFEGDEHHRNVALSVIRGDLSPEEQRLVMLYACDAAWALSAFKADPVYSRRYLDGGAVLWPADAIEVVLEARRLVGQGLLSHTIDSLVSLLPDTIAFQKR